MKTIAIISIAALLAMSCGNSGDRNKAADSGTFAETTSCSPSGCGEEAVNVNSSTSPEVQADVKDNCVEVLCFHGKKRCATCIAIENNAKEALESNFSVQIKDGSVVFRVIDISLKENEAIAEKYEVTWSALMIVRHKAGEESVENMTEFAFSNARRSPDVFKAGLVKAVNESLE